MASGNKLLQWLVMKGQSLNGGEEAGEEMVPLTNGFQQDSLDFSSRFKDACGQEDSLVRVEIPRD